MAATPLGALKTTLRSSISASAAQTCYHAHHWAKHTTVHTCPGAPNASSLAIVRQLTGYGHANRGNLSDREYWANVYSNAFWHRRIGANWIADPTDSDEMGTFVQILIALDRP
jgi:hypothetical protein